MTPPDAVGTVLVTSRTFGSGRADPVRQLEEHGLTVRRGDHRHRIEDLAPLLPDAVAWIAGAGPIGAAHLARAPRLRHVARYGVGTDAVNRDALAERGIVFTNTPGANADAVADHTIGLILTSLRRIVTADQAVRRGKWSAVPGRELGSCVVGIVGFGNIGRAVRRRLGCFGAQVIVTDPFVDAADVDVPLVPLDQALPSVDILTLHVPAQPAPIVDAAAIRRLPRGAIVVNTSRAGVVDETAVAKALHDGHLAGAAFDLLAGAEDGSSPLLAAPNVVLTPHIAGQTVEAIDRMGLMAAEDVVRVVVRGIRPFHPVDLTADATREGGAEQRRGPHGTAGPATPAEGRP